MTKLKNMLMRWTRRPEEESEDKDFEMDHMPGDPFMPNLKLSPEQWDDVMQAVLAKAEERHRAGEQ